MLSKKPRKTILLKIEYLCLKQFYFFSRRHRRYFFLFIGMYLTSIFRWKSSRLLRAGYCFIQLLDDILDGDRLIDDDPSAFADRILSEILAEQFGKSSEASMLIGFVLTEAQVRHDYMKIKEKFAALVIVLKDDYVRRINRRSDLACTLKQHHRLTFQLSMDITLAFLDSEVTSEDCPEIVESLVWCSVMRDLRDDLSVGIINIPKDVYTVSSKPLTSSDIDAILNERAVQKWIRAEFKLQSHNMAAIGAILPHLKDNIGKQAVKIFWKSIKSYVPKFEKQNIRVLSGS